MTKTLWIAGATGYVGRNLVTQAARAGHRVFAHIRPGSSSSAALGARFREAGATVVELPWTDEAWRGALAEQPPDVIFGLLGTTRARVKATEAAGGQESYASVDRDLTLLLMRAAAALPRPPRFVYLSSLGADKPGGNAYLRARTEVEAALLASTLPWTIARPSFITGEDRSEDRPGERYGAAVADAGLSLLGKLGGQSIADRFRSISGAELAGALLALGLDPGAAGQVVSSEALQARARTVTAR